MLRAVLQQLDFIAVSVGHTRVCEYRIVHVRTHARTHAPACQMTSHCVGPETFRKRSKNAIGEL